METQNKRQKPALEIRNMGRKCWVLVDRTRKEKVAMLYQFATKPEAKAAMLKRAAELGI